MPSYDSGTEVTIEALPNPGFEFTDWSGDINSNDNPVTITIECDKKITANFSEVKSYAWLVGIAVAGIVIVSAVIFMLIKVSRL